MPKEIQSQVHPQNSSIACYKKTFGLDGIPAIVLKNYATELSSILTRLLAIVEYLLMPGKHSEYNPFQN